MKEIPILFSTPMVQAIMDGRKTKTRRVMKPQPGFIGGTPERCFQVIDGDITAKEIKCPYGKPGDILWVRETWCDYNDGYSEENKHLRSPEPWILYKADCKEFETAKIWRPSIFMPKTICRIWIQVTKVRAERLQDITKEDALDEGIQFIKLGSDNYKVYLDYLSTPTAADVCDTAKDSFKTLWQKINGLESWDANPWVWVIEFKVLSTTGKPNF